MQVLSLASDRRGESRACPDKYTRHRKRGKKQVVKPQRVASLRRPGSQVTGLSKKGVVPSFARCSKCWVGMCVLALIALEAKTPWTQTKRIPYYAKLGKSPVTGIRCPVRCAAIGYRSPEKDRRGQCLSGSPPRALGGGFQNILDKKIPSMDPPHSLIVSCALKEKKGKSPTTIIKREKERKKKRMKIFSPNDISFLNKNSDYSFLFPCLYSAGATRWYL